MLPTSRWLSIGLTILALFAGTTAWADRPSWAGGGHHQDARQGEFRDMDGRDESGVPHAKRQGKGKHAQGKSFTIRHTNVVRNYYTTAYSHGRHCPPGLAKKGNGCLPPGVAKTWMIGHPLSSDIVYTSLPSNLLIQLGSPGPGYQFVRVAGDILKIAIGSNLVIDAIQDLGR